MEKLKKLSSEERAERIKLSYLSSRLTSLSTPGGFEYIMSSPDFSQEEKDFILFHITELKELSKVRIHKFKEEVEKSKSECNNA